MTPTPDAVALTLAQALKAYDLDTLLKGAGEAQTLPLTAGQCPRPGVRGGGVQVHGFQQVGDPPRIAPPQCIGEHLAHVPARFEGSQRILDDHGQLTSARSPSPFG